MNTLNGPKALELLVSLTIYEVQPVTGTGCSISVLHPGALLVTKIEYKVILGFY
jgi:hypothetical protein